MTYIVHTPYGTAEATSREQAAMIARDTARITGKTVKVEKKEAPSLHDDPCVCSVYNRCNAQREQDFRRSGNWRDLHRAYND